MSKRKDTYVLFRKGHPPRVYVNPENIDYLKKQGDLVRKPNDKKLNKVPIELWKYEGGNITASSKDLEKAVKISVHEHTPPEIREIEVEKEYIVLKPYMPWFAITVLSSVISFLLTMAILITFFPHWL